MGSRWAPDPKLEDQNLTPAIFYTFIHHTLIIFVYVAYLSNNFIESVCHPTYCTINFIFVCN